MESDSNKHNKSSKKIYQELDLIGKGSFGLVRKVRRIADDKILVWKQMDYSRMSSRQKQQLVTEVNVLKQLSHPNIVSYYDRRVDHSQRKVYIVMEYCSGGDLAKYLKEFKATQSYIPEDIIWKFIYQIILALDKCHNGKRKVIHRDIKPANIFIDETEQGDKNLKLGDFGLSRELGEHSIFAQTNVGTPYYMSPEQLKESRYNEKSDVWSTGCIFYEMASLRRPFQEKTQYKLTQKILEGKFQRIPDRYSDDLQRLIENMLTVDSQKRFSTQQILQCPYLSIREKQKHVKHMYQEVSAQEQRLRKKKMTLLKELQLLQMNDDSREQKWKQTAQNLKRKKSERTQQLRFTTDKQNFQYIGNMTDRS